MRRIFKYSLVALVGMATATQATVVYQDDFEGAAGSATNSTPEVTVPGWGDAAGRSIEMDGSGKLQSAVSTDTGANYRFRIATDPLTSNSSNDVITLTANVRMPSNAEWIAIGFHSADSASILGGDGGPFLRFNKTDTWLSPGGGTANQVRFTGTHAAGSVQTVKMVYYVDDQYYEVFLDGNVVGGTNVNHTVGGIPSDPVVHWANIMFRKQALASAGGAYIDDLKIEVDSLPPASNVIFSEDFEGAEGFVLSNSTPEVISAGFYANAADLYLDGAGKLQSTNSAKTGANYRARLGYQPLTSNPSNDVITLTANVRMPSNGEWIAIGFHSTDSASILGGDGGPFVRFSKTHTWLSPGAGTANQILLSSTHASGSEKTVKMVYYVDDQYFELFLDGNVVGGAEVNHTVGGIPSDPVVQWANIMFRKQEPASAGGAYVEDLKIEVDSLPPVSNVIFSEDFEGDEGSVLSNSTPEVTSAGFYAKAADLYLDGAGKLQSTNSAATGANYRARLGYKPLTDDSTVESITLKATLRMPPSDSSSWVAIGFNGSDSTALISADANSGPFVRFDKTSTFVSPGGGTRGQERITGTHTAGQVVALETTYHVASNTYDVYFGGNPVVTDWVVSHDYPEGTNSAPVIQFAHLQLRQQADVVSGGAYVDSLEVTVTRKSVEPEDPYDTWAGLHGVTGGKEGDDDGDELSNWGEYVFGGDPVPPNGADSQGTPQVFDAASGDYIWEVIGDETLTANVLTNIDLVSGSWGTNAVVDITSTNGVLEGYTNNIGTSSEQVFIKLEVIGAQ